MTLLKKFLRGNFCFVAYFVFTLTSSNLDKLSNLINWQSTSITFRTFVKSNKKINLQEYQNIHPSNVSSSICSIYPKLSFNFQSQKQVVQSNFNAHETSTMCAIAHTKMGKTANHNSKSSSKNKLTFQQIQKSNQ